MFSYLMISLSAMSILRALKKDLSYRLKHSSTRPLLLRVKYCTYIVESIFVNAAFLMTSFFSDDSPFGLSA